MTNLPPASNSHNDGVTSHDYPIDTRFPFLLRPQYRLATLIIGTILIAIIFVAVGLVLYNVSGTAQLDLSRPGFEGVSEIIDQNASSYQEFPSSGQIDQGSLSEFDRLYQEQLGVMNNAQAFEGDPLSPESLGIKEVGN